MSVRRSARTLIPAEVVAVAAITPRVRRISLAGSELRTLAPRLPAQWLEIYFPAPLGRRLVGRAVTIRHFDAATGILDLDIILHGDDGPASWWAARARAGDTLHLSGPCGGCAIDQTVSRHVLIGDATALPAMTAITAALPRTVQAEAFIEVTGPEERQPMPAALTTHWLYSEGERPGTTGQIELAVQGRPFNPRGVQVWLAGEAFMVRALLTHLLVERGVLHTFIHSEITWTLGVPSPSPSSSTR